MDAEKKLFVGVIPDGNRRWAMKQCGEKKVSDLSSEALFDAYQRGSETVKKIAECARDTSIDIFAIWGGSISNLSKRGKGEIIILHKIYKRFLIELRDKWMNREENQNIRFAHMGRRDNLPGEIMGIIGEITEETKNRTGMVFALCLDYEGRDEEKRAHDLWSEQGAFNDANDWKKYLDLPIQGVPYTPVRLILRTGLASGIFPYDNEFLHSYKNETRFEALECLWPDFTPEMFKRKINAFLQEKQRRGK